MGATYIPPSVGSSVDLSELTSAVKADWEYAYSAYKTVISWRSMEFNPAAAGGTYFLAAITAIAASVDGAPLGAIYLDPNDFSAGSRTVKYRIRATCEVNANAAPGITFTAGLYPITAVAGGSGVITMTADTVVTGSTVPFTTPATSSITPGTSGDFTAPAAGLYAIGILSSGSTAAGSDTVIAATLQMRQV